MTGLGVLARFAVVVLGIAVWGAFVTAITRLGLPAALGIVTAIVVAVIWFLEETRR